MHRLMPRALDPFHRIRATVGALFALAVLVMVLGTALIAPGHTRVGAAAIGAAALPGGGALVAGKHRPARAPVVRGARTSG